MINGKNENWHLDIFERLGQKIGSKQCFKFIHFGQENHFWKYPRHSLLLDKKINA